MFIRDPYIICPNCSKQGYGILGVYGNFFRRRCKYCFYPTNEDASIGYFRLPALQKKIIYLDQFAISNMMKALNPETSAHKRGAVDDWLPIFEKLDKLCKMQLIMCPYSNFHYDESVISGLYSPLERLYQHLSYGIKFADKSDIFEQQIIENAKAWITKSEYQPSFDPKLVLDGNPEDWQDCFIVHVSWGWQNDQNVLDILIRHREQIHGKYSQIFLSWQADKIKSFQERFAQIASAYCSNLADDSYANSNASAASIVMLIKNTFKRIGVNDQELQKSIDEYLESKSIIDVPYVYLYLLFNAALARKGQSDPLMNPPNKGMVTDIEMIASLLPYCDAMFIDNACRGYLNEEPLRSQITYNTKLFSYNNKQEFIDYLDEIEANPPLNHLALLDQVYGNRWKEPYTSIYTQQG